MGLAVLFSPHARNMVGAAYFYPKILSSYPAFLRLLIRPSQGQVMANNIGK